MPLTTMTTAGHAPTPAAPQRADISGTVHTEGLQVDGLSLALHLGMPPQRSGLPQPEQTPLLLVHSVNAAACSAEMQALFERQRAHRPVAALDLPGFGRSERAPVDYTPARMSRAVAAALRHLSSLGGGQAADVVALSLGCEFATLALTQDLARARSLTLINPTGAESHRRHESWGHGATRATPLLHKLLRQTPIGHGLFALLKKPASVRWFLKRVWGHGEPDPTLLATLQHSAQAPGAEHAALDFVAGALFTRGIVTRYRALALPVWLVQGRHGPHTDVDGLKSRLGFASNTAQAWQHQVFDTGAMPQAEAPDGFDAALRRFHASLAVVPSAAPGREAAPASWRETVQTRDRSAVGQV